MNRKKDIGILATASLPWLTGASIAPLFQGVFLKKMGYRVTLYLPWTSLKDQREFIGPWTVRCPEDQAGYVRHWLPEDLRPYLPDLKFYRAWFHRPLQCILPLRNMAGEVGDHDTVIVAEPEHVFGMQPWSRFKKGRPRVVGIVMTHYLFYLGLRFPYLMIKVIQAYNLFLMRRTCHRIIPISPVEERVCAMKRSRVMQVNAVHPAFFTVGRQTRARRCYFMGKLIPEKGLKTMFKGLGAAGIGRVDLFGGGDVSRIEEMAAAHRVTPVFKGQTNAPWKTAAGYRIFVNCSKSEYFCTTTANALVMQQWVVIPRHPSNRFFLQFKNCLAYDNFEELVTHLKFAFLNEPEYDPEVHSLSWETAAEKLAEII